MHCLRYSVLGTPHAEDWEEIEDLPFYRANFPQWPAKRLDAFLPLLSHEGIDLIEVRLHQPAISPNCVFDDVALVIDGVVDRKYLFTIQNCGSLPRMP